MKTLGFRTRMAGAAAVYTGLAALVAACGSASPGHGPAAASTAATAATAATPASNGITAKPARQIVTTAFTALKSAVSVRMYGSFSDSGQRYKVDLTMGPAGMRGSMTAPFEGAKLASVDLVLTRGKMYARSSTLWRQVAGAGVASLLDNRWVILPAGSVKGFPFASTNTFIKQLNLSGMKSLRKARAGVKTTVNGQPAVKVASGGETAYIATTGHPYPLELIQGSHNALYFQYSAVPASIVAPPHPIDLSTVRG